MSWQERYEVWLDSFLRATGEAERATTISGLPLEPLYGPHNTTVDPDRLGFPGQYPYTRGVYPSMYRTRPWTIRQFAGFGDAGQTNRRFHELVRSGQQGLSVAFDLPTLMGLDSDDDRCTGEVGHCGVAIDSARDMQRLFEGLPLDRLTTSMTINGPAVAVFAMFVVAAEREGVEPAALGGTLQTDILKEYMAQKEWLFPPEPHLRLIGDLIEFCTGELPRYHPLSISGYHIREAGATAVQELAYTLANGFSYVELGMGRGLHPDAFVPRFSFFFDAHIDFFEEIAKFRAARRIWARWMRDRYQAGSTRAQLLRFHTQTAGVSLTAQQPENNVVRTAIEGLAGVLGGTQSLHTNALDEVLALPSDRAARIALRTQQVIAEETGVTGVIDPLGGSWFVEALTDELEQRAEREFERILADSPDGTMTGGILRGIADGRFTGDIADAAAAFQARVDAGEFRIVGVNVHVDRDDDELELLRVPDAIGRDQAQRVAKLRRDRDHGRWAAAMEALERAATTDENLVVLLLDSVRADATVGEITRVLQGVWGTFRETPTI